MRISGYDHQFRAQIIQAALTGFRKQCVASDSGGTPLFRPRFFERSKRRKNKLMAQQSWYRAQCDIVGFLPPTPGAKLLSGIQQIVREEGEKIGLKIKVVEQSGTKISSLLTTPDLSGCLYPRCHISEEGASHSRRGANYTATCLICGNVYHGETGFGAHTRVSQHREDIRKNSDGNSISVHLAEQHPAYRGDPDSIIFSVTNTGPKPLLRQIREAVKISNTNPDQVINSRSEYIRPVIQRLTHTDLIPDRGVGN